MRLAPGGYVGITFSRRSGRSANSASRYSPISMRTISLYAADRAAARIPVGVDAHAVEDAVAHPPEDPEAVPLAVRRDVRVEPLEAGRDAVVVVGRRPEPRRRPLEHEELADDGRDLGDELDRARAGADHRDALAPQVDVVVPARRVERRTGERVAAGDVGEARPVQLADRADDRVGLDRLLVAVGRRAPGRSSACRRRTTRPRRLRCRSGCRSRRPKASAHRRK